MHAVEGKNCAVEGKIRATDGAIRAVKVLWLATICRLWQTAHAFILDPVKLRVALPAADPPDTQEQAYREVFGARSTIDS